jgi:hypothetical protein
MIEKYLCCVTAAAVVLLLGCFNPKVFQAKDQHGQPSGHPNYLWLAAFALMAGVAVCMMEKMSLERPLLY